MKISIKVLIGVLLILLSIIFGAYLGYKWFQPKVNSEEQSTILLEKIKNITQLATVQGELSEIYKYKEHQFFDIAPFQKKALIRVKAKVLVGYKIDDFALEMDDLTKTITITDLGDPEILSIDHDLDYYDIDQGTFNYFSNEDYNNMNSRAKNFVLEQAKNSELMTRAVESKDDIYETLRFVIEGAGWNFNVEKNILPPQFQG